MRTQFIAVLTAVTLCAPGYAAAQAPPSSKPSAALTGSWMSAPYEMPLSTDFDKSVWGPNAKSVREVSLTITGKGQGTLTVSKKVLDAKGHTVPGSASIEEAHLTIGALQQAEPRPEYAVTVVSAERRYPDDKDYTWKIEGLRIRIAALDEGGDGSIEIRYDTPEGRGSFWETLHNRAHKVARQR